MVLASLVFSDFTAMRHVGGCCRDDQPAEVEQTNSAAITDGCSHDGCEHSNPFRRHLAALLTGSGAAGTEESYEAESVATTENAPCPCSPPHDSDRCAVCHWFFVISSGVSIDAPLTIECGELLAEPVLSVAGLPARMMFLPTVSRRGPPVVA
jgi:hypothetical protein